MEIFQNYKYVICTVLMVIYYSKEKSLGLKKKIVALSNSFMSYNIIAVSNLK